MATSISVLAISGVRILAAGGALYAVDASDPRGPQQVGVVPIDGVCALAWSGDRVYAARAYSSWFALGSWVEFFDARDFPRLTSEGRIHAGHRPAAHGDDQLVTAVVDLVEQRQAARHEVTGGIARTAFTVTNHRHQACVVKNLRAVSLLPPRPRGRSRRRGAAGRVGDPVGTSLTVLEGAPFVPCSRDLRRP